MRPSGRLADEVALITGGTSGIGRARLDVLFNNAGVYVGGDVTECTEGEWDLQIGVNLKGTYPMCAAAVLVMIARGGGVDGGGVVGWPGSTLSSRAARAGWEDGGEEHAGQHGETAPPRRQGQEGSGEGGSSPRAGEAPGGPGGGAHRGGPADRSGGAGGARPAAGR